MESVHFEKKLLCEHPHVKGVEMVYREEIVRLYRVIKDRRDELCEELTSLPEGELYIRIDNNQKRYYHRLPKSGNRKKERRFGIKKQPDLLKSLVRKEYIEAAIPILEKDLKALETLLGKYRAADENSVMESFLEKNPELAEGIYYGRGNSAEWTDYYSGESDYHAENLISTASDGSHRRSKAEILIGAKLDHYNIPYRYEAPAHPDLPYIPDFTLRRPSDGKLFYWEHLGMVNNREYMRGYKKKFEAYEEVGIVPWENLIVTYDQADGGINEKLIDSMIQGWLLR